MGKNTAIQWAHHTWNPWKGCTKVSPGCKYCYAERNFAQYGLGEFNMNVTKTKTMNAPLGWAARITTHEDYWHGQRIFTCSWSDFFHEAADQWRADAWTVIKDKPEFNYLILTKRPQNVDERLPEDWGDGYPNVWLGISAENQDTFNERIGFLDAIPAAIKFISAEPLIDELDITAALKARTIDWVIAGGESGVKDKYRPCKIEWLQRIVADCQTHCTLVFVKQLGTTLAKEYGLKHHGGVMEEMPCFLQVREFPAGGVLEKLFNAEL